MFTPDGKEQSVDLVYNEETGKYQFSDTVTAETVPGLWRVYGLIAEDVHGNVGRIANSNVTDDSSVPAADLSAGDFTIITAGEDDEDDPKPDPEPDPTPTPGPDPTPAPTPTPDTSSPVGRGASAAEAEKAIMNAASEEGPAGTEYGLLKLKSKKQTGKSITLNWSKVKGAAKYVIYGSKCGKTSKMVKLASSTGKSRKFKKIKGKKIKKGTYYKFIIVALDKNNKVVSTSKVIHVAAKGGKVGNHKSIKVSKSVIKKAKSLKKGKTLKLKAKAVKASQLKVRTHRKVAYESSNPKIATVSKKGVVKAKKKGKCYVYAYAQNGVYRKIKVIVK